MGSRIVTWLVCATLLVWPSLSRSDDAAWVEELDHAHSFIWQPPTELRAHLEGRSEALGGSLREFVASRADTGRASPDAARRLAIAQLLLYLAHDDSEQLAASVASLKRLRDHLGRFENRYWYHYVLAHKALAKQRPVEFSEQIMALWLRVVVPLEGRYEELERLSLHESPNSGFASALPSVYENITWLILYRTGERGVDRDLDGLSAVVRLLARDRVTSLTQPLRELVALLDGPLSDDGSLSFALALSAARSRHERLLGDVQKTGWTGEATGKLQLTAAAYERALELAETTSGRCAALADTLRLRTDVYASRIAARDDAPGADATLEVPGSPERAIEVYAEMAGARGEGWPELGFHAASHQDYLSAMEALWRQIQHSLLMQAEYQLSRAVAGGRHAGRDARRASTTYGSFLEFFDRHAPASGSDGVSESAHFAAFRAALGVGHALLEATPEPRQTEIDHGILHYQRALQLFPFDRVLWTSFAAALGRHGREGAYAELGREIAERVRRSNSVDSWIDAAEPAAAKIEALRSGLSDSFTTMYMGFAQAAGLGKLEGDLEVLRARRDEVAAQVDRLTQKREQVIASTWIPASPAEPEGIQTASPEPTAPSLPDLETVARELAAASQRLERIDEHILARSRALPLYRQTLESDDLRLELLREDHPLHRLLRRMYQEGRS